MADPAAASAASAAATPAAAPAATAPTVAAPAAKLHAATAAPAAAAPAATGPAVTHNPSAINPVESVAELFSAGHIMATLTIIATVWVLLKILEWAAQLLARKFSRYRMQITALVPVVRLLTWLVAIYIIIANVFNPPQNTLLAMMASVGLAVGLAAQDLIRNLISGVIIMFEQPFRVGDMVKVGEHYGEVTSIGLRSVQLQTFDDNTVTVPNSSIASQSVANSNAGKLDEMVVVSFLLPASVSPATVKDLAWEAAACSPYVYLKKPIIVLVEDVFDRTFLTRYTLKAYVLDVRLERRFASDMLERVKTVLLERGLLTEDMVLAGLYAQAP